MTFKFCNFYAKTVDFPSQSWKTNLVGWQGIWGYEEDKCNQFTNVLSTVFMTSRCTLAI